MHESMRVHKKMVNSSRDKKEGAHPINSRGRTHVACLSHLTIDQTYFRDNGGGEKTACHQAPDQSRIRVTKVGSWRRPRWDGKKRSKKKSYTRIYRHDATALHFCLPQ